MPVVEAPEDLLHLGRYVLYGGHHRREAAVRAGILLPAKLLENDEDIQELIRKNGQLSIDGMGWEKIAYKHCCEKGELKPTYLAHRESVWDHARVRHLENYFSKLLRRNIK